MTLRQSVFQVREMLLDYHENKLDSSRSELVKKVLATDVETQRAFNQIIKGLDFAKQVSKIEINESFGRQLLQAENATSLISYYASFKNWNQAFRASTYAVAGCLVAAILVLSLPRNLLLRFKNRSNQEVVLSQVMKPQGITADSDDPEKRDAQAILAQNLPTDTDEEDSGSSGEQEASGDEHAEPITLPNSNLEMNAKTFQNKAPVGSPPMMPTIAHGTVKTTQQAESSEGEVSENKKTNGFVFRGNMKIDEIDVRTPLISQQILDLGGRKAGEVELGWRKENKGSYYHFSMPEENYEKLVEYLHGFGPVRFSKDSHPRVMPQGQIRIILWVERNNE